MVSHQLLSGKERRNSEAGNMKTIDFSFLFLRAWKRETFHPSMIITTTQSYYHT